MGHIELTIDEIRDAREVEAAKRIANQGVVLLATAHGTLVGRTQNKVLRTRYSR